MVKEVCFLDRVVHYETTLVRADLHLQFKQAMLLMPARSLEVNHPGLAMTMRNHHHQRAPRTRAPNFAKLLVQDSTTMLGMLSQASNSRRRSRSHNPLPSPARSLHLSLPQSRLLLRPLPVLCRSCPCCRHLSNPPGPNRHRRQHPFSRLSQLRRYRHHNRLAALLRHSSHLLHRHANVPPRHRHLQTKALLSHRLLRDLYRPLCQPSLAGLALLP